MKYNKGSAMGVLLIAVIVLVVGGFLYYKNKDTSVKSEYGNQNLPVLSDDKSSMQSDTPSQTQTQTQTQTPSPSPSQENSTVDVGVQISSNCTSSSAPSITIVAPAAGASLAAGTSVPIEWQACNVATFSLALASGGKDFGEIYAYHNLDIDRDPAQHGSYQWKVTNPAQGFTNASTNNYQIVAESISPSVLVRSGVFTVH